VQPSVNRLIDCLGPSDFRQSPPHRDQARWVELIEDCEYCRYPEKPFFGDTLNFSQSESGIYEEAYIREDKLV
jgi:hypothetical protein